MAGLHRPSMKLITTQLERVTVNKQDKEPDNLYGGFAWTFCGVDNNVAGTSNSKEKTVEFGNNKGVEFG